MGKRLLGPILVFLAGSGLVHGQNYETSYAPARLRPSPATSFGNGRDVRLASPSSNRDVEIDEPRLIQVQETLPPPAPLNAPAPPPTRPTPATPVAAPPPACRTVVMAPEAPVAGDNFITAEDTSPAPVGTCATGRCGTGCCDHSDRVWFDAEYLLWWIKAGPQPALVSTGTLTSAGIADLPGTEILVGGQDLERENRYGGRFTLGTWLNDDRCWSAEATFLFTGKRTDQVDINTNICGIIARPFCNTATTTEFVELVSFPGLTRGDVLTRMPGYLLGAEANVVNKSCCGWCYKDYRVEMLGGFRYLNLTQAVDMFEHKQFNDTFSPAILAAFPGAAAVAGENVVVLDHFGTQNQFYGGQVGLNFNLTYHSWAFDLRGKVAAGVSHEIIDIVGSHQITTAAGVVTSGPGGFFAHQSNGGHHDDNEFAVVPELDLNVGYQVCSWLDLYVGYTYLYWSKVFRPGDQIDRHLDPATVPGLIAFTGVPTPGVPGPVVPFKQAEFWAQGVNFAVEFHW